jgi:hypothetical protein
MRVVFIRVFLVELSGAGDEVLPRAPGATLSAGSMSKNRAKIIEKEEPAAFRHAGSQGRPSHLDPDIGHLPFGVFCKTRTRNAVARRPRGARSFNLAVP